MGPAEHPSGTVTESVQLAPLSAHERAYLRRRDTGATRVGLFKDGALMVLVAVGVALTPTLHSFWPLFGFGIALLVGAALAIAIYAMSKNLRADLSAGVKHWDNGTVNSMWIHPGAEAGERPTYRLEISVDGDGTPRTLSFTITARCYETVAPRDRVRIAYAPRSLWLLNLIDGDYEYTA